MKRGFDRRERISDLMQKELAKILLTDLEDERIKLVTVVGVSVSRDLSYAKVYVTVLMDDPAQIKETIQALNRAAKLIRFQLAKNIKLRIMPELKFVYDDSTARGFRLSSLINDALKKSEK